MAEQSMKYTFVCEPQECDTMIEVTVPAKYDYPNGVIKLTCPCGREMSYISVILQPTTTKEETMSIIDETPIMVKALQEQVAMLESKVTDYQNQISYTSQQVVQMQGVKRQLLEVIDSSYENQSDSEEILNSFCEILDYEPIKTVQFEGVIHFSGSIDIPMHEVADFDLSSALEDVYVDINNGNVVIDNYELYSVEEPY